MSALVKRGQPHFHWLACVVLTPACPHHSDMQDAGNSSCLVSSRSLHLCESTLTLLKLPGEVGDVSFQDCLLLHSPLR